MAWKLYGALPPLDTAVDLRSWAGTPDEHRQSHLVRLYRAVQIRAEHFRAK